MNEMNNSVVEIIQSNVRCLTFSLVDGSTTRPLSHQSTMRSLRIHSHHPKMGVVPFEDGDMGRMYQILAECLTNYGFYNLMVNGSHLFQFSLRMEYLLKLTKLISRISSVMR